MPTTNKTELPKYFQSWRDIRRQRSYLLMIAGMFIVTAIYALGLRSHTVRVFMLCLSFVFPIVIIFSLSAAVPTLSYIQLDKDGLRSTILGFIHKRIYWSDVESVGKASLGNDEGLGILYKSSVSRYIFGRKSRRKMFGWDELLPNVHSSDGASLLGDASESFKKHSSYDEDEERKDI